MVTKLGICMAFSADRQVPSEAYACEAKSHALALPGISAPAVNTAQPVGHYINRASTRR
jgi:hypothetical protein